MSDQHSPKSPASPFDPFQEPPTVVQPVRNNLTDDLFADHPSNGLPAPPMKAPETFDQSSLPVDQAPPPMFFSGEDERNGPTHNTTVPADETEAKIWHLAFYQQFFDVSTNQVLQRLSNTLIPLSPPDFLIHKKWHLQCQSTPQEAFELPGMTINPQPDLYGPFWVCTTLWMSLGIVSNIASRIADKKAESKDTWHYDFSMASVAAIIIYLYCFLFGTAVWGVMAWKNLPVSLVETLCLYGYSMFIFILITFLCMVPVAALQWVLVCVGGLWSTAYLILNFWQLWKDGLEQTWFIGLAAVVSVFHVLLTLSFKFYFLHYNF